MRMIPGVKNVEAFYFPLRKSFLVSLTYCDVYLRMLEIPQYVLVAIETDSDICKALEQILDLAIVMVLV